MARPPAYHLHCEDLPTMHASNDLDYLSPPRTGAWIVNMLMQNEQLV